MSHKSVISDLKASSECVGRLYPILLDKHGNVIDGMHRLEADEKWPKIKLENVETEEQRLIARLVSNACRRHVPAQEKTEMLERLGEIYMKEGVELGEIAHKIAEKTGMSYTWVMKYLLGRLKDSLQSERAGAATRRAAGKNPKRREEPKEIGELTAPPKEKFLTVKKYANTHFVSVMVEKPFYTKFEKVAEKLGTTPDVLISNALLLTLKKLEKRGRGKTREEMDGKFYKQAGGKTGRLEATPDKLITTQLNTGGISRPLSITFFRVPINRKVNNLNCNTKYRV